MFRSLSKCALHIASPRRCPISQCQPIRYLKRPRETGRHSKKQRIIPITQQGNRLARPVHEGRNTRSKNGYSDKSKYLWKYYGIGEESFTRFEEHISEYEARRGIKSGQLIEGHIRVSKKNPNIVFVSPTDGSPDIFISNSWTNKNRALNGDLVAVEVRQKATENEDGLPDNFISNSRTNKNQALNGDLVAVEIRQKATETINEVNRFEDTLNNGKKAWFHKDSVLLLNNYAQTKKATVSYKTTKSGTEHDIRWSVKAVFNGREFETAQDPELKVAKREAAGFVLAWLWEEGLLQTEANVNRFEDSLNNGKKAWIHQDSVLLLNNYAQTKKATVSYKTTKSGTEHDIRWSVKAVFNGREFETAQDPELKVAKREAAGFVLAWLWEEGLLQTEVNVNRFEDSLNNGKKAWIYQDSVLLLHNYAKTKKATVSYKTTKSGPEHNIRWSVKAVLNGREFETAHCPELKVAKREAAGFVLAWLWEEGLLQTVFSRANLSRNSKNPFRQEFMADDIKDNCEETHIEVPGKSRQGKVVSIIQKKHPRLCTGYIDLESVKKYPDSKIFFHTVDESLPNLTVQATDLPKDIFTNPEAYSKTMYAAKILDWNVEHAAAEGKLLKNLGHGGEIEAETMGILFEYEVDTSDFSQKVLDCLPKHNHLKIPRSEFEKRKDMRSSCIFTIDPSTARDIDDALSCEDLGNGLYKVGVHIADVSHFVLPDTELDTMASQRSTSHYLVQRAIPMLPPLLSEELCSLNPNVERLAFSVEWTIKENGEVISEWFGRSVIKSCVKLSYEQAQGFINEPNKEWDSNDLPSISEPFSPRDVASRVLNLHKLAVNIRKRRDDSGTLRLDKMKLDFRMDPDTQLPNGCHVYEHKDSNKLIEEFMLLANMSVARVIKRKFPDKAVLRRHPPPKEKMLRELKARCEKYGIDMDITSAGSIQKSLEKLDGEDYETQSRLQVLVAMCTKTITLAKYFCAGTLNDDSEFVHYALNVPLYTHFTSPIRRYPDILVHRLLGATLGYNKVPSKSVEKLEKILEHANLRKEASKRVSEKSADLFFGAFLKTVGPIEEKAIVMAISKSSFDIFVVRFGVSKSISFKDLPHYEFMQNEKVVYIHWPPVNVIQSKGQDVGSQITTQKIELFTMLDCVLQVPEDQPGLKWKATIVRPQDDTPSGKDFDPTISDTTNSSMNSNNNSSTDNSSSDFSDDSSDSESSESDIER